MTDAEPCPLGESNLSRLDLNLLDTLAALLEERNLTHAGVRMGLSQPAMSVRLGRLRQYFGDELLVRIGRDYRLTPFGHQLLPKVSEARMRIARVLRLEDEFDPRHDTRIFRLATSDYISVVMHAPLQRHLDLIGAGIRVHFIDMYSGMGRTPEGLLGCDLAIAPLATGIQGEHEFLFRDRLVCIADVENERVTGERIPLEDFAALRVVAARMVDSPVMVTERWLDQEAAAPRIIAGAPGFLGAAQAVRGTDCVALVPERLARKLTSRGRFKIAEPPGGLMDVQESLHWHASRSSDPALRWMRRTLADLFDGTLDAIAA